MVVEEVEEVVEEVEEVVEEEEVVVEEEVVEEEEEEEEVGVVVERTVGHGDLLAPAHRGDGVGPEALQRPVLRGLLLGFGGFRGAGVQHGLQDPPPRVDEPKRRRRRRRTQRKRRTYERGADERSRIGR